MEQFATYIIESLIFPPGLIIILLVVATLLLKKRPLLGKLLLWFGLIIIYTFSTPFLARYLISHLETHPALELSEIGKHNAGAIVILASGRYRNAREYGGDTVDRNTLVRCRYGALLQRKTGLPILVSGGLVLDKDGKSLAQVMAEVLKEDFQAGELWMEGKSSTTGENALLAEKFLKQKNVETVYLVTQAAHMQRSVIAFEKTGLKVVPAPTVFMGKGPFTIMDLLPGTNALNVSRSALHEIVGAIWYGIRY